MMSAHPWIIIGLIMGGLKGNSNYVAVELYGLLKVCSIK